MDAQLYDLAIIDVTNGVLAAFYYLRIIKIMYFDEVVHPLDKGPTRNLRTIIYGAMARTFGPHRPLYSGQTHQSIAE